VTVRLLRNGAPEPSAAPREVELSVGSNTVRLPTRADRAGPVTYRVEIAGPPTATRVGDRPGAVTPAPGDRFPDNDHRDLSLEIPGKPRVLVIDAESGAARHLVTALGSQHFEVEVRSPLAAPLTTSELEPFQFVITSNLDREQLSDAAERTLEAWVTERGGSLLVAGGRNAFGAGGWLGSSFEQFLPLRSRPSDRQQEPEVALVLVIDRSSSMAGLPIEMARNACAATVGVLGPTDRIEIIGFNTEASRIVPPQSASARTRILGEIARIDAEGGTHMLSALQMAHRDLAGVRAARRHVVVLTDGLDAPDGLLDEARSLSSELITLSSVALGAEADHELLRQMAEVGGGRFHAAADPSALPRIFVDETQQLNDSGARDTWCFAKQRGAARFLAGIDLAAAPALHGANDAVLAPGAQELLATDGGSPLLARWRRGAGWVLAFASDLRGDWSTEWVRWGAFNRLTAQLVREHRVDHTDESLPLTLHLAGDELVASLDLFDEHGDYELAPPGTLAVSGGTPVSSWSVPLVGEAPGRYVARTPLPSLGEFRVEARLARPESSEVSGDVERRVTSLVGAPGLGSAQPEKLEVARGHLVRSYPEEFERFAADWERLERMARAAGTPLEPSVDNALAARGESRPQRRDLAGGLLGSALLLLLVDVALRRLPPWRRRRSGEQWD